MHDCPITVTFCGFYFLSWKSLFLCIPVHIKCRYFKFDCIHILTFRVQKKLNIFRKVLPRYFILRGTKTQYHSPTYLMHSLVKLNVFEGIDFLAKSLNNLMVMSHISVPHVVLCTSFTIVCYYCKILSSNDIVSF